MPESCPVCGSPAPSSTGGDRQLVTIDCESCGRYLYSPFLDSDRTLRRCREDSMKRTRLRYWLSRQAHDSERPPVLDETSIETAQETALPSVAESADLLVAWIARLSELPGRPVRVNWEAACAYGGIEPSNFGIFLRHLRDADFVLQDSAEFKLTVKGWERYESILHKRLPSRRVFMAMQYGDRELDEMYESCFKPAVADAGLTLVRLDDETPAGIIDNRLRAEIRRSVMLLADLTHGNRGAYWEAGFAEGLGLPVLYLCRGDFLDAKDPDEKPHFDTNHCQIVPWSSGDKLRAGGLLTASIRATIPEIADRGI